MSRNKNKDRSKDGDGKLIVLGTCDATNVSGEMRHDLPHQKTSECDNWKEIGAADEATADEAEITPRGEFKVWLEKHVNVIPLQAVQEMEALVDKFFPQE